MYVTKFRSIGYTPFSLTNIKIVNYYYIYYITLETGQIIFKIQYYLQFIKL